MLDTTLHAILDAAPRLCWLPSACPHTSRPERLLSEMAGPRSPTPHFTLVGNVALTGLVVPAGAATGPVLHLGLMWASSGSSMVV